MTMAVFAILFGTRHIEATEHQEGLMLAIATESVVKIAAFLIVGCFITYSMFGGIGPLIDKAAEQPEIIGLFARGFHGGTWLTVTFLSLGVHPAADPPVPRHHRREQFRRARWDGPPGCSRSI